MNTITKNQTSTTIVASTSSAFTVYGIATRDDASKHNIERALTADATAQLHRAIKDYLAEMPSRSDDLPLVDVAVVTTTLSPPDLVFHADASITRTLGLTSMQVVATAVLAH